MSLNELITLKGKIMQKLHRKQLKYEGKSENSSKIQ